MSLTVTVQKGHDFSSGNITRAALNAGAVPTVAVTGSVSTTEIIDGAVTTDKLAADAVEEAKIKDGAVTEDKLGADAVTLAKIDDESIVSDNLITKVNSAGNTNVIEGLTELEDVAVDDWMMVHDESVTGNGNAQLKKIKVSKVQKVGTTEYALSDITGDLTAGSGTNFTLSIDMDGSPFQTVSLEADKDYNITVTNLVASKVKTVTVRIKAPATGTAPRFGDSASSDNWPTNWSWPERTGNIGPPNIASGKVALLSITSYGETDADVVAAYAVTV